jgi:hypothetical protein
MKRTFTSYQIAQAFQQAREKLAFEYDSVQYANSSAFSIAQVERMVMDILQPVQKNAEAKQAKKLEQMKDDLNDVLFG